MFSVVMCVGRLFGVVMMRLCIEFLISLWLVGRLDSSGM